ncbi:enoyl-CoA hydratase [Nocardioides albertanoniae]|uniref:Enoyl-CoA hydratase n=1 Tax=Nocardioides albertanoniae TaxID=1175486 RepID=A0A543AAU0_9ACTN|nr:enoyl-CoA hydratase-related protein [Nocardioides albertanoniae]TQL69722.1 enoyl-CoA hydratase [Nocardioides albertanoniae]
MSLIRYECTDGCARITMTNPERGNVFSPEAGDELREAILRAKADAARVIVLAAEGKYFSVGGDLAGFAAVDDMEPYLLDLAEGVNRIVTELVRCDAVVISAVQGTAAGVGFPLAAAADIVVASEKAKFSLAYAKVGLSPDGGGSLLVHTLGLHRVLRLTLLGDMLSASEALDAGLVARVVPADGLEAAVDEVVANLLSGSPEALARTKHLVRGVADPNPESALRREAQSISALGGSASGREGINAFLEKRAPSFGA